MNPVSTGDVIVVGIGSYPSGPTAVSDLLGSSYTLAGSSANVMFARVYYATIGTGGTDQVTVSLPGGTDAGVYIYEVSGATTAAAASASGFGFNGPPTSVSTSTSVTFPTGAFLLGEVAIGQSPTPTFNPGIGFTASPIGSTIWSTAEYSVSGVSSPTNFHATFTGAGGSLNWAEVGLALAPTANPSPVGGQMIPINRIQELAPWAAAVLALTVIAAESLLAKSRKSLRA